MCHELVFLKTLERTGSTRAPFPEALLLWMQVEPRHPRLMSAVGASVPGLRTTLEEALLEIPRDRRWCLSKKGPRSSESGQKRAVRCSVATTVRDPA